MILLTNRSLMKYNRILSDYDKYMNKKFIVILFALLIIVFFSSAVLIFKELNDSSFEEKNQKVSLINNWILSGSKSIASQSQILPYNALKDKNMLNISYNLHGLCVMSGDASSITIIPKEGNKKYSISFAEYGQNCHDGEQTIEIPLSNFEGLNPDQQIQSIEARFWYPTYYNVEIKNAVAYHADTAVLGASTPQRKTPHNKTFPNISPIRPFPYAATNSAEFE